MAEPVYLFYGDLQINQLDFLNKAANDVPNYINSQPWSKKRKERVMNAYSDIMNQGLKGASNSTGRWVIDINGDGIDFDSKSNKEKEAYQEAAYIILQQMSKISTVQANQPKKDLLKFDNEYFTTSFDNYISDKEFGGRLWNIGGEDDDWNKLDERNELGIRGTKNRADKLANLLESYSNSLKEDEYDFEGSPFENLNDFKTRIHRAVQALRSKSLDDDDDALNAIGLKSSKYFNTGANDSFSKDNYLGTYQDYYQRYLPEQLRLQEENKRKEEEAKKQAIVNKGIQRMQNAWNRVMVFGKGKTGNFTHIEDGMDYLNSILQKDKLTNEEVSEVLGAFQLASKNNGLIGLSREEIDRLPGNWRGRANSLRKINGIEGMYLDSASGNIVKFRKDGNNQTGVTNFLDILLKELPENKEKEYLNSKIPGITNAEWLELGAIAADIGSIVDPEPISAAVAGGGAAGMRHIAKNLTPGHKWTLGEIGGQGIDYVTGMLGAIPLLGDGILAAKVISKGKTIIPILTKSLRYAARAGALKDIYDGASLDTVNKILNGEELTVQDWRNIGQVIRGLAATRTLNVTNRALRKALKERGYEINDGILLKSGFVTTTPKTESLQPFVKMNVNGTEKQVKISPKTKEALEAELIKKGNNPTARAEIIKNNAEVLAAAQQLLGITIKDANGNITDAWKNIEIPYNTSFRNSRIFGNRLGIFPKWMRTTGDTFGIDSLPILRKYDNFENFLNSDRGVWSKIKYGSNRTLKGMDKFNLAYNNISSGNLVEGIQYLGDINLQESQELKNAFNVSDLKFRRSSKVINPKDYNIDGKLIDGNDFKVEFLKNSGSGEMFISFDGGTTRLKIEGNSLNEMKKELGRIIKEKNASIQSNTKLIYKTDDPKWKDFVNSIRTLKRKGYLFQKGGQLNLSAELIVSNFLNNKNENNF